MIFTDVPEGIAVDDEHANARYMTLPIVNVQGLQGAYAKNWRRNTGIAFVAMGFMSAYVWKLSCALEEK
jgi:hypothetical protein